MAQSTASLELERVVVRPAAPPREVRSDEFTGLLPSHAISPETLAELHTINPWLGVAHVAFEWLCIFGAMALCQWHWHPLLYVAAVMWIGARQHALAVLMHDGAHYRILRSRRWNDVLSETLLAWPLFVTMRSYRRTHFAHHRHVNTSDDPDWLRKQGGEWRFPKSWRDLLGMLLADALALNTIQTFAFVLALSRTGGGDLKSAARPAAVRKEHLYVACRLAYTVALIGGLAWAGLLVPFLIYWMVPLLTWFKMILRVRSIAEHFAVENDHVYTATRTTYPSWFERLFVASKNVNYHLDHHLYPAVPFYRLPKLHALLMESAPFREKAHCTRTYWGVLRECVNHGRTMNVER